MRAHLIERALLRRTGILAGVLWLSLAAGSALLGQDYYGAAAPSAAHAQMAWQPSRASALSANLDLLNSRISVKLDDVRLIDALGHVVGRVGLGLTYGSRPVLYEQTTTLNLVDVTVLEALHEVLRDTNIGMKLSAAGHVILVDRPSQPISPAPVDASPVRAHRVVGIVRSAEEGLPLPGVNVVVKGTQVGATTNEVGYYQVDAPTARDTLVFSFVGYVTQQVPIAGRTAIDIALQATTEALEEVVVVAYGEKSRVLLTESIGTVSALQIQKLPAASPDAALQGRVSGVQVTSVDGTPGSPVAIRIRGVGTVGNTQPLFVVDGIPIGRGEGSSSGIQNPLATINPSDIQSISVLKDASAAAAYGVRAANGVVLITTKRGEYGRPKFSFDGYSGVQQVAQMWDMLSTEEYVQLWEDANDAFNTQRQLPPTDPSYLVVHPDLASGSPYRGIDNSKEWIDDVLNQNAPIQNYNLSVSGASQNLNYYMSAGYFGQDATAAKWNLDRYTFRVNSDYKVGSRFRFGESIALSYQEVFRGVNGGGDGWLLNNAATMPPFHLIYDDAGDLCNVPGNRYGYCGNWGVGGVTVGNQNGINSIVDNYDRTTRLLGGLFAEVDLVKGLRFRSAASLDLGTTRNDGWSPGYTDREMGLDRRINQYGDSRGESLTQVFTNTLTYDVAAGKHTVNALGGIEYQKLHGTSLSGNAEDYLSTSRAFYSIVKNGRASARLGGGAGEGAFLGFISRVSYDYANKYLLTGTLRRDGSSNFSPEEGRRWGTFPSVSAAWRISQEPFFNVPAISELKLRGGWGQLGNDQTQAFPHVFRVSVTPDYGLGGSTSVQAPAPVNFVNEDVTWETVETIDFGIDASLFDDRLSLLATYYRRETKDFLVSIPIPNLTGFGSTSVNAGSVMNKGFEFEVGYNTMVGDRLRIDMSANLTTVDNELTALSEGINEFLVTGQYRTGVGYPIGYFYGYKTDGLYQTDAEASAALPDNLSPTGPRAGDIRFVDVNGPAPADAPKGQQFSGEPDGKISPADRTYLGKTIPDYFYGFNINATWGHFDLSLFFQGVGGLQLYNAFANRAMVLTGGGRNLLDEANDRWTGQGTSSTVPRAVATDPNQNARFSDRWVENADFFRFKNLQLGYTVPAKLTGSMVTGLRIYLAATNIFTITPYSGLDPEVMTYRSNGSQIGQDVSTGNPPVGGAGTDQGNIPQPRTLQVGLQFQF